MVDTLRADHLGCYGYHRDTSPTIDALVGDRALRFTRVRAQYPSTYPSVNSILTSKLPSRFIGQKEDRIGIPGDVPTLADAFKANGYSTLAVSSSPIVTKRPNSYNKHGGYDRGFDLFDDEPIWEPASSVNRHALRLLENTAKPFFLYLHYTDPHSWYGPPVSFKRRWAGEYEGHDFIAIGNPNPIAAMLYLNGPQVDVDERDINHLVDLYDEEIAYFDSQLARLLDKLTSLGLMDNTMLVLTSDHGESFLENGDINHSRSVAYVAVDIPLIVKIPWLRGSLEVNALTQAIDIAPTLLDLAGLQGWQEHVQGRNMRPAIELGASGNPYVFSNSSRYWSVDDGHYRLVVMVESRQHQLFDVVADPLEQENIYNPDRPEVRRLEQALKERIALEQDSRSLHDLDPSADTEKMLQAIGYLD